MLAPRLYRPLPADDFSLIGEYRMAALCLAHTERKVETYIAWIERMEARGYAPERAMAEWGTPLDNAWKEVDHLKQRITSIALMSEGRVTGATVAVDYTVLDRLAA